MSFPPVCRTGRWKWESILLFLYFTPGFPLSREWQGGE